MFPVVSRENLYSRPCVPFTKPADEVVLNRIHNFVRDVLNSGPDFESLMQSKEAENPNMTFLRQNGEFSMYYRWNLFCTANGYSDIAVEKVCKY